MKLKTGFSILYLLFFVQGVFAQLHARDVFDTHMPITWLGLDFSKVRIIGDHEKFSSTIQTQALFEALDDLMLSEKEKFNIGIMLGRPQVIYKLDVTKDHNAKLNYDSITNDVSTIHNHLKQSDIEAIVSDYDFKGNAGIGLMFNMESLNKTISQALI